MKHVTSRRRVPLIDIPRRVLLYSGSYNHITDGVTLTLNRLVTYLESHGVEVLVVAPTTRNPELDGAGTFAPAPSIPAPGRKEYRMGTLIPPALRHRMTSFKPDVIHVATPDLLGRWTMSYGRRKQIPIVTTYHTDFTSYLSYYNLDFLESPLIKYLRYFYSRCDLVCVPSQSMINELGKRGIDGNMRIWARGVETDRFSPTHRSIEWRRGLGVADGIPLITYVGRLVQEKNIHLLAEVHNRLNQRQIPHKFMIVGEGPERAALQAELPGQIFTGHLRGQQLARAYASSDIFFFPSTTETFGNVVLEGMASGLPSVCAVATGSSDLVIDGQTGFLTPVEEIEQITAQTVQLAVDPILRAAMGWNARQEAENYRWEVILQKMVQYYCEASTQIKLRPQNRRIYTAMA